MNAKEYLQQAYKIHKRIRLLRETNDVIRADLYAAKSPQYNSDKIQSSVSGDAMERMIARADEITRDLNEEQSRLIELQNRIRKQIDDMPGRCQNERQQRECLYRRYVLFKRWEQIADDMNVSVRYVYMLHGNALKVFERLYKI